jgi:hypothetical protein
MLPAVFCYVEFIGYALGAGMARRLPYDPERNDLRQLSGALDMMRTYDD